LPPPSDRSSAAETRAPRRGETVRHPISPPSHRVCLWQDQEIGPGRSGRPGGSV